MYIYKLFLHVSNFYIESTESKIIFIFFVNLRLVLFLSVTSAFSHFHAFSVDFLVNNVLIVLFVLVFINLYIS